LQGHDIVLIASSESAYNYSVVAKPEQFVDLSLLQQLEKEGFFTEMAKRYQ